LRFLSKSQLQFEIVFATTSQLRDSQHKQPNAMASTTAVYSTEALKERNAQQYKSMTGRVHPPLLKALDSMGYE